MLTGRLRGSRVSPWCGAFQLKPRPAAVPPNTMDAPLVDAKQKLDSFRQEFLRELPDLAREMIDVARAEGTTQAYEKVLATAMKVVEGVQVETKKDQYAHLPVINVVFGPGMEMATTVMQVSSAAPLVEDVTPKAKDPPWPFPHSAHAELPDDPLDLLPPPGDVVLLERSAEEQATLASLTLAASAMVLVDD